MEKNKLMHLFFFDQYISFDMLAPIIYKLSLKKSNKIFICNFFKIQNYNNNKIYKYIISKNNVKELTGLNNFEKKIFYLIVKIFIFILPKNSSRRFFRLWQYIWKEINFLSYSEIIKQIEINKIKTISFDESLYETKRKFLVKISKEKNLKMVMNHGGLYTLKAKKANTKKFKDCSYYMSPNEFPKKIFKFSNNLKKKIYKFGSPRFDIEWLKKLEEIYSVKKIKNKKLKVAIFVRQFSQTYGEISKLVEELKKDKKIDLKINFKPRDVFPSKFSSFNKSDKESSELIIWADLVLSYSTSIIFEIILRDKPLVFLDYMNSSSKLSEKIQLKIKSNFKIPKNKEEVIKLINEFKSNYKKKNYFFYKKYKSNLLNNFISSKNGKNILNKYSKFYDRIVK